MAKVSPKDRWGGTPLGDAERGLYKYPDSLQFQECVRLLKEANQSPHSRLDCDCSRLRAECTLHDCSRTLFLCPHTGLLHCAYWPSYRFTRLLYCVNIP